MNERSWDYIRIIVLFILLLFIYIEPNPTSQTWADGGAQGEVEGQLFQQLLWPVIFIFCCLSVNNNWKSVIKQFDALTIVPFAWIFLTSIFAVAPAISMRRYLFMALVAASIMTIMPTFHNQRRIRTILLSVFAISTIYSYFYVFARPQFGTHQATGTEPHLAGNWRGQFAHKNLTAGVSALELLTTVRVFAINRFYFLIFFPLQFIMLLKTHGKTAALLTIPVYLLVYLLRSSRSVIFTVAAIAFPLIIANALAVGSLYDDELHAIAAKFLGDGGFTGRDELWRLLVYYSGIHPFTGSGYQSFWQINVDSPAMIYGGTWTSGAFYGHQAYLDLIATIGIPGMIIACAFLILRPAFDLVAIRDRKDSMLAIYLGLWLFPLFQGVTESVLFQKADPSWVGCLIGIVGLRMLAVEDRPRHRSIFESRRSGGSAPFEEAWHYNKISAEGREAPRAPAAPRLTRLPRVDGPAASVRAWSTRVNPGPGGPSPR